MASAPLISLGQVWTPTQWNEFFASAAYPNVPFLATGATLARTMMDRASDVANILDYGGGVGGDDAAAMRAAIASGKKLILVPPGVYTFNTAVAPFGVAEDPVCVPVNDIAGCQIFAYGARFLISNALAATGAVSHFQFGNNSRNVGLFGAELVGNSGSFGTTQENVPIGFHGVSGLTIRDCKATGNFLVAIAGVYGFEVLVDNYIGYNLSTALDLAHVENMIVSRCKFFANPAFAVTGVNLFYDAVTAGNNPVTYETGGARSLVGGVANNFKVLDSLFFGFGNGLALDGVQGALVSRCTIMGGLVASSANGQGGILLYQSGTSIAASKPTADIVIENNEVYGNGVTAGGGLGAGVLLSPSAGSMANVLIRNNRIYDNTAAAIASLTGTALTNLLIEGNDFNSRTGGGLQASAITSGAITQMVNGWGLARNNAGQVDIGTPYGAIALSGQLSMNNNLAQSWKDASGNYQPIMGVNPANLTFIRPAAAAAAVAFENYAGTALLTVDSGGNAIEATVPLITSANITIANNVGLLMKDSGGTARPILSLSATNVTFLRPGAASAWTEMQDYAGVSHVRVDNNGNIILNAAASAALAAGATNGFLYVPTINGPPTGSPGSTFSGTTPMAIDIPNAKVWFNCGSGVWKGVTIA